MTRPDPKDGRDWTPGTYPPKEPLFPNRRYSVRIRGEDESERTRTRAEADDFARALSREDSTAGEIVEVHVYDEGEPTGVAHYRNGRLIGTEGDVR